MPREYDENPITDVGVLVELTRDEIIAWIDQGEECDNVTFDDTLICGHDNTHPADQNIEINAEWLLKPDSVYKLVILKELDDVNIDFVFVIIPGFFGITVFPFEGGSWYPEALLPDTLSLSGRYHLPGFRQGTFESEGSYDCDHPVASAVLDNLNAMIRLYELTRFYHNETFNTDRKITIRDCRGLPYGVIKDPSLINKFHNFMLYHHQYINLRYLNERSLGQYQTYPDELVFSPNESHLNGNGHLVIPMGESFKEHSFIRDSETNEIIRLGDGFMEYGLSMFVK